MIFVDFRFKLQRALVAVYFSNTLRAGAGQFANGQEGKGTIHSICNFRFFDFTSRAQSQWQVAVRCLLARHEQEQRGNVKRNGEE